MPGLEEQLVDLFESLDEEMAMTNSSCGNILISGNSSSDKTDLARTIVRAINYVYPDRPKKIAKTSGESINQRGITKAMGKLKVQLLSLKVQVQYSLRGLMRLYPVLTKIQIEWLLYLKIQMQR